MIMPITILTSIFPSRIEQQQRAVSSWLELGFKVISLNIREETDRVKNLFTDVTFVVIDRSREADIGCRIYLQEVFSEISSLPGNVFGIVNSDIIISARCDFTDFIESQSDNAVIFGSRIDLLTSSTETSSEYPYGYDYFFFNRIILQNVTDSKFCLGMPVWDYWFPLSAAVSGFRLKRLVSPVAWHIKHDEAWAEKDNDAYWPLLEKNVRSWLASKGDDAPIWKMLPHLNSDWRGGSHCIRNYLQYLTEIIYYPDNTNKGIMTLHVDAFSRIRDDLLAYSDEMERLSKQLSLIVSSGSWRLTAPVRRAKTLLQRIFE